MGITELDYTSPQMTCQKTGSKSTEAFIISQVNVNV